MTTFQKIIAGLSVNYVTACVAAHFIASSDWVTTLILGTVILVLMELAVPIAVFIFNIPRYFVLMALDGPGVTYEKSATSAERQREIDEFFAE